MVCGKCQIPDRYKHLKWPTVFVDCIGEGDIIEDVDRSEALVVMEVRHSMEFRDGKEAPCVVVVLDRYDPVPGYFSK